MKAFRSWFPGGFVLAAAAGIWVSSAGGAAPSAHFPYLPGGAITQIEEGGGYLFAVTGTPVWVNTFESGRFLYSRHPDSASWKRVRSMSPAQVSSLIGGRIRFQGSLGGRVFFNLEDTGAYFTDNGGAGFTRVADLRLQSNVESVGSKAFAVFGDTLYTSLDTGRTWTRSAIQLAANQLVAMDGLIYAKGQRIQRSDDSGRTWVERMEGLPPSLLSYGVYRLHRYGGYLVCSSDKGVFMRSSASSAWAPMGSGYLNTRKVFGFGTELTSETNTRFHRYDPGRAAWQEYEPWGFSKPMSIVSLGFLCGILAAGPRWIVGQDAGLMSFDPGTSDYAWHDAGIHQAAYVAYGAVSGALVALHRSQLFAVPPDGIPAVLRDFRIPGTRNSSVTLGSSEPADSILWVHADSTLYRLERFAGTPSIRDSVRAPPGKYFCQGRDIIGLVAIPNALTGLATDSVAVRVSRDAGMTFKEFSAHLSLSGASNYPPIGKFTAAYFWNDSVWLWDEQADFHVFDFATGAYRFGETSIPPQAGFSAPPAQGLSTGSGLVFKQGNSILHSSDGGVTWNLGTRGISGTLAATSRIQKHGGRLFLASGDFLYHSAESEFDWSRIDLKTLSGASGGVSSAIVAGEGIYVHRVAEDVVLMPWPELPAAVLPPAASRSPNRTGATGNPHRVKGLIILRNGVGYTIQGKVIR